MNEALMAIAYQVARENYKTAGLATFKTLDAQFGQLGFDTIHHTAEQAMRLHIATLDLAQKVWAKTLSYEKAEEIISNQFSEFPASIRQKALSNAYTDTR